MSNWTYEKATEFNFPNITIYRRLKDGIQTGWRMNANDGYVFYDTSANDFEIDPATFREVPVIYYYKVRYLTLNRDFTEFPFVAVLESETVKEEEAISNDE